jgi:purine-nucleoside phosphorylase
VVVARGKDAKKEVLRKLGKSDQIDGEIDTEKVIANHEEVLETSAQRASQMQQLVKKIADIIYIDQ